MTHPLAALLKDVPRFDGYTEVPEGDMVRLSDILAALEAVPVPDLAEAAIAELQDVMRCRCNKAYTDRGMHDPDCQCDSQDALDTLIALATAQAAQIILQVTGEQAAFVAGRAEQEREGMNDEKNAAKVKALEAQLFAADEEIRKLEWRVGELEWLKDHGIYWQEVAMAFNDAITNWPAIPTPQQLKAIGEMPCARENKEDWARGKTAQATLGLEVIPPVSEMERAAGLWLRMTGGNTNG